MEKYIPVVVIKELSEVDKILPALKNNGINCAEITFRTDCAKEAIKIASEKYNDMLIGAGTVINELEAAGTFKTCKCIFHWFTGTDAERRRAIENGALFSINRKMLRTKSGQETIKDVPEESILLETDAPFTMKYNSTEDLKSELIHLVEAISDLRKQDMYGIIEANSAAIMREPV